MSILDKIKIEQVHLAPTAWNTVPVLHEVLQALQTLGASAQTRTIDLLAMPFGPGDEDRLMEVLGQGEVDAVVRALGETRILETRFPGVWLLDHYNEAGERIAFQIEITDCPAMLRTQTADIADSVQRLAEALHNLE